MAEKARREAEEAERKRIEAEEAERKRIEEEEAEKRRQEADAIRNQEAAGGFYDESTGEFVQRDPGQSMYY